MNRSHASCQVRELRRVAKSMALNAFPAVVPGDAVSRWSRMRCTSASGRVRPVYPVSMTEAARPAHPDPSGVRLGRVVAKERQRDVAVQAGEQMQHRWVIHRDDRAEPVLHVPLVPDESFPTTGQRPQLGQQRRRHRQRPPMTMFVPQRIG